MCFPLAVLSSESFHDTLIPSTFVSMKFVISVSGLVKSSYKSFTEVTNVVWVLFRLWAYFLTSSSSSVLPKSFAPHFCNWCLFQSISLRSRVVLNVFVLVIVTLNPGWLACRDFFQFPEHINILWKKPSEFVPMSNHVTSYSRNYIKSTKP